MKRNLLIASAILVSMVMAGCSQGKTETKTEQDNSVVLTKTDKAIVTDVAQVVDFTANLEPEKKTFISPSMAVRIEKIYVEVGDRVRKGQLLAQMDKNQLNQSSLQLKNSEMNLARLKAVYESGGTSKQQIDELETSISVMKETLANLEKNLELRSPFDGIVTGRYNEEGDLFTMGGNAAGGMGILQVMQVNPLKAIVAVSEQYLPYVTKGMNVTVNADVYADKNFNGKVSLIYPSIDAATRTFNVEVTVPNANSTLKPGMFARTTFNMGDRKSIVVSDLSVLKQNGTNERYVYVIKDGVAERRSVRLGRQVGDRIEVLSGVNEGEDVAIAGLSKLSDGASVEVKN